MSENVPGILCGKSGVIVGGGGGGAAAAILGVVTFVVTFGTAAIMGNAI